MSGLPSGIIFVHGMENNPKSAVEEFAQVMDNDYEHSGVVLGVSYAENAKKQSAHSLRPSTKNEEKACTTLACHLEGQLRTILTNILCSHPKYLNDSAPHRLLIS